MCLLQVVTSTRPAGWNADPAGEIVSCEDQGNALENCGAKIRRNLFPAPELSYQPQKDYTQTSTQRYAVILLKPLLFLVL